MTEGADTTTLLETNGLAVRRHGEALLDGVTLRVRRGSVHVIVGPNGAGKTTLLSAILNQIPFDGEIAMNWIGSGAVGYVPQTFAVDPTLPVTVADTTTLLETNGLAVRRHGEALLDGVTLRVGRGSVHVIVGPNGAGKTTLLSAILNQIPFDGEIAMNWVGSGAVGYVPQTFAVDPTLPVTVADFLALTRQRRPVCLGLTRRARAEVARLLAVVGLSGLAERPLAVLSGGELRRVLLAHAIDPEPELLLLDEPTAGFDESAARIFESILMNARRTAHTTVVMVSHDLELVRRVADRVTVLNRQIVVEGAPDVLSMADVRELLPVREVGPAKAGHYVRRSGG